MLNKSLLLLSAGITQVMRTNIQHSYKITQSWLPSLCMDFFSFIQNPSPSPIISVDTGRSFPTILDKM